MAWILPCCDMGVHALVFLSGGLAWAGPLGSDPLVRLVSSWWWGFLLLGSLCAVELFSSGGLTCAGSFGLGPPVITGSLSCPNMIGSFSSQHLADFSSWFCSTFLVACLSVVSCLAVTVILCSLRGSFIPTDPFV